jgi:uncharacterized membrane protein YjgN (DUF898 family)
VPATHEVLLIAATASVIAAVARSAFGIARFSGQSWVPSWYRHTLAALFCTLLLLVAAAVVVAIYIEDRHIESSKVNGAAMSTSIVRTSIVRAVLMEAVASHTVEQLPHHPSTTR